MKIVVLFISFIQTLLHTNTHGLLGWDHTPHWDEERLIVSSNAVWVRPRPMFRSINKLVCRFGKLTLMPAFLPLYLLFLYFYFSSTSMSVNAQSLHIEQTQTH